MNITENVLCQNTEGKRLCNTQFQNGMSLSNPFLQGPDKVGESKEIVSSRHSRTDRGTQNLTTEEGKWMQSPTPMKKLFTADNFWEREN